MASSLQKAFENGIDHPKKVTKQQIQRVAEKLCKWHYGDSIKDNREWIKETPEELERAKHTIKLVLDGLKIKFKLI